MSLEAVVEVGYAFFEYRQRVGARELQLMVMTVISDLRNSQGCGGNGRVTS